MSITGYLNKREFYKIEKEELTKQAHTSICHALGYEHVKESDSLSSEKPTIIGNTRVRGNSSQSNLDGYFVTTCIPSIKTIQSYFIADEMDSAASGELTSNDPFTQVENPQFRKFNDQEMSVYKAYNDGLKVKLKNLKEIHKG